MYDDDLKLGITFAEVLARLPGALASPMADLEETQSHFVDIRPLKCTKDRLTVRTDDSHFGRIYYPLPLPHGDILLLSWAEVTVIKLMPAASMQLPATPADTDVLRLVKSQEVGIRWWQHVEKLTADGWELLYEAARVQKRTQPHDTKCTTCATKPANARVHIAYHAILTNGNQAVRLFNRNNYFPYCC